MIAISEDSLHKIKNILNKTIPNCEVRAFGSRVNGTNREYSDSGMKILKEKLGLMQAERFVTLILREPFDYTKWRQDFVEKFEDMSVEDVSKLAMQSYSKSLR